MLKKHSTDDVSIDMNVVAKEVIMGPKNRLVKKLDKLNSNYITSDYVYGNRSLLTPLKPIGVTNTYRWKSGYKETVTSVIIDRMLQYTKKTSNLETLLNGRPSRMEWTQKRFIKELCEIDSDMRDLRRRKITMEDTSTKSVEFLNTLVETILEKKAEADELFDNYPDIEYDMYIVGYDDAQTERHKERMLEPGDCNVGESTYNRYIEVLKYNTYHLVFDVKFLAPELIVRRAKNGTENEITTEEVEVGRIPLQETYLTMQVPIKSIINCMYTKNIGDFTISDVRSHDNNDDRWVNDIMGVPDNSRRRWRHDGVKAFYDNRKYSLSHPFISDAADRDNDGFRFNKWLEDTPDELNHVCFGNMGDQIERSFVNLDFMGLMIDLVKWQTYVCGKTHPLNNVYRSLLSVPEEQYSEDFYKTIGCPAKELQSRLLNDLGAHESICINPMKSDRSFNNLFKWQIDTDWGNSSYDRQGLDWYRISRNIEYGPRLNYGWNIFDENWVPHRAFMNRVMNSKEYELPESENTSDYIGSYTIALFTDHEEYSSEKDEEAREHYIRCYKERIISIIHAFVDYLNEDKCRTRSSRFFKSLERVLSNLYGEDTEVTTEVTAQFDDIAEEIRETLVSAEDEVLPFDEDYEEYPIPNRIPVIEPETTEDQNQLCQLDSEQEMMDMMEANMMMRRR